MLFSLFRFRSVSLFTVLSLALGGCSEGLINRVDGEDDKGAAFSRALKHEYLKLARQQGEIYNDHIDARHFAIKARQAGSGVEVTPEYPADWRIPDRKIAEMNGYRERLFFALHKGGRRIAPQLAAEAQVSFDCWVEEEDDGHKEAAQKCMKTFKTKLKNLEAAVHEMSPLFVIWFNVNSTKLGKKADMEIRQIVRTARQMPHHKISVRGFTDGVGGRKFNLKLSQARAQAVKKAIVSNGIEANRVATSVGMGEVFGTRELEPNNRRVEVQLH